MNAINKLLLLAAIIFTASCTPFTADTVIKTGGEIITTGIKADAAKDIAGKGKDTIVDISKNKTKRHELDTEVERAEIKKDDAVNNAIERAIVALPPAQQIPLLEHALKLRGQDIEADKERDIARHQSHGLRNALIGAVLAAFLIFIGALIWRATRMPKIIKQEY